MTVCRSSGALLLILLAAGCGGNKVLVPPRLDLRPYGKLGLVTFTVENAKGSLHQFATERFAEEMLAAQPGIEVLELGPIDSELDAARAQQLGKERGVAAVFAGHLKCTNPTGGGPKRRRGGPRRRGRLAGARGGLWGRPGPCRKRAAPRPLRRPRRAAASAATPGRRTNEWTTSPCTTATAGRRTAGRGGSSSASRPAHREATARAPLRPRAAPGAGPPRP